MKVWIKFLIGTLLGILAAFILPKDIPAVNAAVTVSSEFALRFARYTLIPLLFFRVAVSLFRLRTKKTILKTCLWTGGAIVASSLILALLGLLTILIVKLPRIPITGEKISEVPSIDFKSLVMNIFPYSGFNVFLESAYLLPAFVFAGFAGAACASDRPTLKPVTVILEAAMKLFQNISAFFIEWISVGMIAFSCYWIIQAQAVFEAKTFIPLFIMIAVDFLIVAGLIYPLILRFLCKDLHPYHVLYASICSILTSFFTGDSNVTLLTNLRHGKESLGIYDEVNNFSFPLFSIFARGGTALVTSICFVTILRSYSSLGFTVADVIWIFFSSFIISFMLGSIPYGGSFVALTVLCSLYGRGFEAGYLLLRPASIIFCSFATVLDALSAITGSYIVAVKTKCIKKVDIRHYI